MRLPKTYLSWASKTKCCHSFLTSDISFCISIPPGQNPFFRVLFNRKLTGWIIAYSVFLYRPFSRSSGPTTPYCVSQSILWWTQSVTTLLFYSTNKIHLLYEGFLKYNNMTMLLKWKTDTPDIWETSYERSDGDLSNCIAMKFIDIINNKVIIIVSTYPIRMCCLGCMFYHHSLERTVTFMGFHDQSNRSKCTASASYSCGSVSV